MRCKACNAQLNMTSFWYKDADGNQHINDLCGNCSFIVENADALDSSNYPFERESDFIARLTEDAIKDADSWS